MVTAIYSILHMIVDGVCAFSMISGFTKGESGYLYILLYNFFAFAMQMPIGLGVDILSQGRRSWKLRPETACAILGTILTFLGAVSSPVILGLGNALFHVGGGVGVMREDFAKKWNGRALGIFVAPGALGLFFGNMLGKGNAIPQGGLVFCLLSLSIALLLCLLRKKPVYDMPMQKQSQSIVFAVVCSFVVVILRSYVGMTVHFSWNTTVWLQFSLVFSVVCGKMLGGFLAHKVGRRKAIVVSLGLAALFFAFDSIAICGLMAMFLFNMTMPITLYFLAEKNPTLLGFSFGLLTFALFLGFLPTYFEWTLPFSTAGIGVIGSLLSLVILYLGVRKCS